MKLPINYSTSSFKVRRMAREQYIVDQEGLCCYCKAPLSGPPEDSVASKRIKERLYPPNFFKHPIHLHHSHVSGMTIGAVHCHCNAVLWEYEGE